jgi:hypothetical protein
VPGSPAPGPEGAPAAALVAASTLTGSCPPVRPRAVADTPTSDCAPTDSTQPGCDTDHVRIRAQRSDIAVHGEGRYSAKLVVEILRPGTPKPACRSEYLVERWPDRGVPAAAGPRGQLVKLDRLFAQRAIPSAAYLAKVEEMLARGDVAGADLELRRRVVAAMSGPAETP